MSDEIEVNSKEAVRVLRAHYRSGDSDLGRDFFAPCLKNCTLYRRAVGFFSSSALKAWSMALPRILKKDEVQIQLLVSPILSSDDLATLRLAESGPEKDRLRQVIADELVLKAIEFASDPRDMQLRMQLMAWLVANERLVLKFAFPTHVEQPGIYHEKIGIFDFPWGDKVAFVGSANETGAGHTSNYEIVHVYRSWVAGDEERVAHTEKDFDQAWKGIAEGLRVLPLSTEALNKVRERAPDMPPEFSSTEMPEIEAVSESNENRIKWRHQEEATEKFLGARHGVLEMATGTGKTRTALKILTELENKGAIKGFIITTEGTDLLDQWYQEILEWSGKQKRSYRVLRNYGVYHQAQSFALNSDCAGLVISRQQLTKLFRLLTPELRRDVAIVHDEVHGLGSPENRRLLSNEHHHFGYCLGLSATPEREYDADGTDFIIAEIGPVIYQFELKDAIERGILCEFDYVALPYELTDDDKNRLKQVYSRAAAREKQGNPMSKEELWIELSRVYKTAEQKPAIFREYLDKHHEIIRNTIIFVDNKEYGARLLPILHEYSHLYRTYYAEDDKANLIEFSKGGIDCLVTCHKLSQGIDIQHLQNVILFSSARAKLETIQRIGRCLRMDPNNLHKRAMVIDFVRWEEAEDQNDSADVERRDWLSELSRTRRMEKA